MPAESPSRSRLNLLWRQRFVEAESEDQGVEARRFHHRSDLSGGSTDRVFVHCGRGVMERGALCLLALVVGCGGLEPPTLMGDDGAVRPGEDAGVLPDILGAPERPIDAVFLPASPGSGWTSPAACPTSSDDAHCSECWSHTDGPRSLGRLEASDAFGESIAVGDFNGDGYPDLAVGAPGEDIDTYADSGMIFVYLGSERGFQPWLTLSGADLGVGDATGRGTGQGLTAGDFNNDSVDDLAISFADSSSQFVVANGAASGFTAVVVHTLAAFDPDASAEMIQLGPAMAVADYDGDGYDDLAVGAEEYDLPGVADAGAVFVHVGSATGFSGGAARIDMPDEAFDEDRLGNSLSAYRQPGKDFLAIGAHGRGVVLGYDNGTISGPYESDLGLDGFGEQVAAGDLDADGAPDIVASGVNGNSVEIAGTGISIASGDPRGSVSLHPLAVVDVDQDGNADMILRSRAAGTVDDALLAYIGTGTLTPFYALPFAASPRESEDELGAAAAFVDLDGDGYVDPCVGAPATATGNGRVHVWYFDPMAKPGPMGILSNDAIDQESALTCDYCAVFPSTAVDGTPCDLAYSGSDICVFGTCVSRACGDGYRQTGSEPGMMWSRESCDDGNTAPDDACSADCQTSARVIVSSRAGGVDSPSRFAPAVAEDGNGNLLFVYTADTGDARELRARGTNFGGDFIDGGSPIILAPLTGPGWDAQASVAGLPGGGWVVVLTYPLPSGEGSDVMLRVVSPSGVPGPPRFVNEDTRGAQSQPRVAALTDGFVVVWTDAGGFDGPLGASIVEARRFTSAGTPMEDEWVVSDSTTTASQPALAAIGDEFLVAWTLDPEAPFGLPIVQAQRFGGASADTAPFEVSESGSAGAEPAVAVLGTDYVAAWTRRDPAFDYRGDVQARPIAASGDPLASSLVENFANTEVVGGTTRNLPDEAPSIAAFGASDYLISYEVGGHRRGLARGHIGATAPPADEWADLGGFLVSGLQGDVTLLSADRGVWFAWSDASPPDTEGALRAFLAFLVPGS